MIRIQGSVQCLENLRQTNSEVSGIEFNHEYRYVFL